MNKKKVLVGLLISTAISTFATGPWASVNELILNYELNPTWSIFSNSRVQIGDDISTYNLSFVDAGLAYKFHDNFKVGAAYRHLRYQPFGRWETEDRSMLQLTWFDTFHEISLRNRNRVEFRYYNFDRKNDVRYRNQSRAEFSWNIKEVKPYIEDEFFYSRNKSRINENWLTSGFYYKPTDQIKLRLAYRWIALRTKKEWVSGNQLYAAVIASF